MRSIQDRSRFESNGESVFAFDGEAPMPRPQLMALLPVLVAGALGDAHHLHSQWRVESVRDLVSNSELQRHGCDAPARERC